MLGSWVRAPAGSRLIRQPQPFVLRLFFYVKVIMCKPTTTPDIKKHLPCRYVVLTPVRCGICAWVAGILALMLAYGCANKVSPRASGKALRFEPQRDHLEKGTSSFFLFYTIMLFERRGFEPRRNHKLEEQRFLLLFLYQDVS